MAGTNPLTFLRIEAFEDDAVLKLTGPYAWASFSLGRRDAMDVRIEHREDGESFVYVDGVEAARWTGLVVLDGVRATRRRPLHVDFDGFIERPVGVAVKVAGRFTVPLSGDRRWTPNDLPLPQ